MPGPDDAGINRRKTMQRHQHRRHARAQARVDDLVDVVMVGIEDRPAPRLGRVAGKAFIARNGGGFADARDRTWRRRRTIAVDHQPRVALRDQMRVEMFRERVGDAGNADIPGDVPRQFAQPEPEIAEHARDAAGRNDRRSKGTASVPPHYLHELAEHLLAEE